MLVISSGPDNPCQVNVQPCNRKRHLVLWAMQTTSLLLSMIFWTSAHLILADSVLLVWLVRLAAVITFCGYKKSTALQLKSHLQGAENIRAAGFVGIKAFHAYKPFCSSSLMVLMLLLLSECDHR